MMIQCSKKTSFFIYKSGLRQLDLEAMWRMINLKIFIEDIVIV